MAYENVLTNISLSAGADLSSTGQYLGVKLDSNGDAVLCDTNGEQPHGVLQNDPASGENATVAIAGLTKAEAGAAISVGDSVAVDSDGQFITAATGDVIVGIAMSAAGGAGEIFTLDFRSHLGTA